MSVSYGNIVAGKGTLYEGGVRSPLIVWGPDLVAREAAGTTNASSILCALDVNRLGSKFECRRLARVNRGNDTALGRVLQRRLRRKGDHHDRGEQASADPLELVHGEATRGKRAPR